MKTKQINNIYFDCDEYLIGRIAPVPGDDCFLSNRWGQSITVVCSDARVPVMVSTDDVSRVRDCFIRQDDFPGIKFRFHIHFEYLYTDPMYDGVFYPILDYIEEV